MDSLQHPAVAAWVCHKLDLPKGTKVRLVQETEYHGYCETCSWEEQVWVVYDEKYNKLHSFSDDLASLLTQVLDYTLGVGNGS